MRAPCTALAPQEQLAAIVEAMSDCACIIAPDGTITYLNPAGRALVGIPEDRASARVAIEDVYPAWACALMVEAAIPGAMRDGRWAGGAAVLRADGSEVPVSLVLVAHSSRGTVEFLSVVIRVTGEQRSGDAPGRQETERLARIIDIQQAIATTSLDPEQVIHSVLQGAQALTRAEGVGLIMRDGADFNLRGATRSGPARSGVAVSNDAATLSTECLRTGRVLRCDDTETDPRVHRESARASGTRSILYMPVIDGTEAVGVVGVLSSKPNAFTDRDEQALTLVAGVLSAAIARAVAFETNQKLLAERTAALTALRESEERYRSVTEQVKEILFETDPAGCLTFVSSAWRTVTGFSVEEGLGMPLLDLVAVEDRGTALDALQPLVAGEREQGRRSVRSRTRDGALRWLELRSRRRLDDAGRLLGISGTLHDVTEQVEAEQTLRLQALTFATIHDAVIVIGPDQRVLDWNPAATEIFGYGRDEAIGRMPTFLGADVEAERRLYDALAHAERWSGEIRVRRKDGSERICESVLVPLLDASGAVSCTVSVSRDVTERRLLEQKLLQSQKLEAIGQLAAGIAHEINTPTQYVGDNVRFAEQAFGDVMDLLEKLQRVSDASREAGLHEAAVVAADEAAARADIEYLTTELPAAMQQALEGTERIAEIVRGMMALSHGGGGVLTPADLNHQLESAVTVSRNEWRYRAELERDCDPALPLVYCHVGEINQVLLNIIVNAAQAIAEAQRAGASRPGRIRVSTRLDGTTAEIRIEDNGCGIPVEARSRIFDPFFTTRGVGGGTGQGLAVAHAVIEKHGGSLVFETEMDVGTTFVVRLPVAGPGAVAPAEITAAVVS